jgi:hypothetical protein
MTTQAIGRPRPSRLGEEHGLVAKAMIFTLVFLAVLGVAALDTASILSARYRVQDAADHAAEETAYAYGQNHDLRAACDMAVQLVSKADASAKIPKNGCVIDPATGDVSITVHKTADTLVAKRISALEKYTKASATSTAQPPP